MSDGGKVTGWVQRLKSGDRAVTQQLWEGYFRRLVALARKRLGDVPRAGADEEDVALSAFDSFCRGAEAGRFPQLDDRHDLWQLLVLLTTRKAVDLLEHEGRDRRDWRRTRSEAGSVLLGLLGREPDPAFAAEVADRCRHLLDQLGDERLRHIALLKLSGHTNQEIATTAGVAVATVERRLVRIRKRWARVDGN